MFKTGLAPSPALITPRMTLPMLLGVLGSIPTVMLERELRFGVISVAEVAGVLLEKGVTLWLASPAPDRKNQPALALRLSMRGLGAEVRGAY